MRSKIEESQTVEMTVSLRKLSASAPWTKKARKAVIKLRKEIQRHFGEKINVVMTTELNNYIFSKGGTCVPPKVRVRVTKEADRKNAEENVFKLDLVVVGSFKGLKEIIVEE